MACIPPVGGMAWCGVHTLVGGIAWCGVYILVGGMAWCGVYILVGGMARRDGRVSGGRYGGGRDPLLERCFSSLGSAVGSGGHVNTDFTEDPLATSVADSFPGL